MKRFFCFLGMLFAFFSAGAQDKILSKMLGVGDRMPDLAFIKLINSQGRTSVRMSDFRGKLLILDFWATSCASCIQAMPELQRLQERFRDRLQILPVSYEKKQRVEAFLGRNPVGQALRLPVLTEDTVLSKLFPHHILSHEVWISGEGRVIAITGPEYVNEQNIREALAGTLRLPEKIDVMGFDYHRPLFAAGEANWYSAAGPYRFGVAPRIGADTDSVRRTVRSYMINFGLLQLYLHAVGHLLYYPKTLLDIRVPDSALIRVPKGIYRAEWNRHHSWCYESVLPLGLSNGERLEAMRRDLNRFFGLDGRMEKRRANSLSLERLKDTGLPVSKGGVPLNTLHGAAMEKMLVNSSLDNLVWELNDLHGRLPATDRTGYTGNVDLMLHLASFRDTAELNRQLAPYGLILRERVQELEFFVLTGGDTPAAYTYKP